MNFRLCPVFSLAVCTTNMRFQTPIMGPFLIVFMVLHKFKTSTELNKIASMERDSKFTIRPWAS